jgi:hypothetical protein
MGIFAEYAPKYWERGLSVIPLNGKRPLVPAWQNLALRHPSDEEKALWLEKYPDCNVGLVLGPASGLVAVDVDSEDDKVLAAVEKVFPPSPWKRRGRKGFALLYKETGQKTFRVIHETDGTICDFLAKGSQLVLPPSIHPDTGKPYTSNVDLLGPGVLDQVPVLPSSIEDLFRSELKLRGVAVKVQGHEAERHGVPGQPRHHDRRTGRSLRL